MQRRAVSEAESSRKPTLTRIWQERVSLRSMNINMFRHTVWECRAMIPQKPRVIDRVPEDHPPSCGTPAHQAGALYLTVGRLGCSSGKCPTDSSPVIRSPVK